MFYHWYYEQSDTYCLGLLDGNVWHAALFLVLVVLFFVQIWRLWPVIRAGLHSRL